MKLPLIKLMTGASLAAALMTPFLLRDQAPFTGHMLTHMILLAIAAPLIVLNAGRHARCLAVAPLLGAGLEFVVVWGWHLPVLQQATGDSLGLSLFQQAMFLGAGIVVWSGALSFREPLVGALALFLTTMHMTGLGVLLVLSGSELYGHELWDQRLGGVLMLAIGTPVYLLGGLWLTGRALNDNRSTSLSVRETRFAKAWDLAERAEEIGCHGRVR